VKDGYYELPQAAGRRAQDSRRGDRRDADWINPAGSERPARTREHERRELDMRRRPTAGFRALRRPDIYFRATGVADPVEDRLGADDCGTSG